MDKDIKENITKLVRTGELNLVFELLQGLFENKKDAQRYLEKEI